MNKNIIIKIGGLFYKLIGIGLILFAFGLMLVNLAPNLSYQLDNSEVNSDAKTIASTVQVTTQPIAQTASVPLPPIPVVSNLPAKDSSLPTSPTLIIPKIGVDATINFGDDGETVLSKGVWEPTGFGNPLNTIPIVLASHRYGIINWTNDYRAKNSFYRLPELTTGDRFSIIWDQRQFNYIVTQKMEQQQINQVTSNVLLYTCKFFHSNSRIVILANRV